MNISNMFCFAKSDFPTVQLLALGKKNNHLNEN